MNNVFVRTLGTTPCGKLELKWGQRTYVMGILNVAPDSFSGDGLSAVDQAVARAETMVAQGADIIDIGGESTRPGASPVSAKEELGRVLPVIERLDARLPAPLSIDTYKSAVAREAVESGASMINDVWGLKKDPALARVAADRNVPLVITQNQRDAPFHNLFPELIADLRKSMQIALDAGVGWQNIIIDPGIGFGKTLEQNLEILRRLIELKSLDRPILVGTSRKSHIGLVLDLPVEQRLEGTAATVAISIANGADMVRVHDVTEMVRVCRMSDAIVRVMGSTGAGRS